MTELALASSRGRSVPIFMVKPGDVGKAENPLVSNQKAWARANGFDGASGSILLCPDDKGAIKSVLFGVGDGKSDLITGSLASKLPKGNYHFESNLHNPHLASLGWLLGAYRFTEYSGKKPSGAKLVLPGEVNRAALVRETEGCYLARDLINMPANDMGPQQLEDAIRKMGKIHKATVNVIKGEKLLEKNFPMIHTVGRASVDAPRLIDLKWGEGKHPKVTLVGKGVIFDSGGLNIKPGNSMALMKKDMGGAANTIALAQMIMHAKLPVRLRLLVPAVENAIAGNAFRPSDIIPSRKGISVEIGNTDAEGRLILGDALTLGDEEKPDLMIDMATLTGAARVALGPDLPPFYTDDKALASNIAEASEAVHDPLWQMPLWAPYQKMLSSKVADVNHISTGGFAGSITAALFLSRFVDKAKSWAHFDIYGWTPAAKPWAPVGGEAQGIRALFKVIADRYS